MAHLWDIVGYCVTLAYRSFLSRCRVVDGLQVLCVSSSKMLRRGSSVSSATLESKFSYLTTLARMRCIITCGMLKAMRLDC